MPVAETELHYHNPYQLIVAVILSAQCTDKRVNMVTPALFEAYPSVEALAQASPRRCFPISKAFPTPTTRPNIRGHGPQSSERLRRHDTQEVDELQKLPGVGKTANVVASVAFNKEAMAVDTHVSGYRTVSGSPVTQKHHSKPSAHW